MTVDAASFKVRFPQFAGSTDESVDSAIAEAKLEVSSEKWSTNYDKGVLQLSAHILQLNIALGPGGEGLESLAPLASKTIGDVSYSFGNYLTMKAEAEVLNLTPYGREYYRLRKLISFGGFALG